MPTNPTPGRRSRRFTPRALVAGWVARLVQRRIRTKGLDLSELTFLPESVRLPLLRHGTDPVPELAELRGRCPVERLDLPFGFAVHLVTGYEQARTVLTDRDSYSNDMRHLFRDSSEGSAADVGGLLHRLGAGRQEGGEARRDVVHVPVGDRAGLPVPVAVPPRGTSATRGMAALTRSIPSRIWRA